MLLCSSLIPAETATAQSLDAATLRRKQDDQERARAMTRALLDSILSVQLRQLEDNGLQDLPVYRDIAAMRTHLAEIVEQEMSEVVEQLAAAQTVSAAEREAAFVTARKTIREVVAKLSAERQGLLKRLKVAELAEQVQRLIVLQSQTQATTESIAEAAQAQQETQALSAQEDQRDVKELFLHLVDTLTDVQTWGGGVSTTAVDGLRVLKAAEVGRHIDQAATELHATRYTDAVKHQTGVIHGLEELLRLIHRNQGLLQGEHRDALSRLRAIAEKQQLLREETRRLPPQTDPVQELVDRQIQLHRDLAEFAQLLPAIPAAEQFAARAEAAADAAAKQLFEGHQPETLEQQSQVLGNLAALEEVLVRGSNDPQTDRTAAELAGQVRQLRETKTRLEAAAAQQRQAMTTARTDAFPAKSLEAQVAEQIAAAEDAVALADDVEHALHEATTAAKSAATALEPAAGPATEPQQQALAQADRALQRALATVESALQETQRQADAVKIGELARAAEALERAAAEERDIVKALQQATRSDQSAPETTKALAERQADVAAIADKVREALADIAPKDGERLAQATENAQAAEQKLHDAAEGRMSAVDAAKAATPPAQAAAEQLSATANELRKTVQAAAQELAGRSAAQADRLQDAADNVEQAMSPEAMSLVDQMARLQRAQQAAAAAARSQQRASGRPEAAAAMELAEQLAQARALQQAADRAAAAYDLGQTPTALQATTSQQAAADAMQTLSDQAKTHRALSPETRSLLEQAQVAATKAARQMLDGQSPAASQSRDAATKALSAAHQDIDAAATQARQAAPTAGQDAAAQRSAAESAKSAEQLAGDVAPDAASLLGATNEAGLEAARKIEQQQTVEAEAEQRRAEQSLTAAQAQLNEAMQRLRAAQVEQLAAQAERIGQLVAPTAPLESGAAQALEAAQSAAQTGAKPAAMTDEQTAAATSAERQLQRAMATLSAKSQELRRDQAVAEALSSLAEQQQSAASTLAEQRNQAMQQAESADPNAAPTVNAEQASQAAAQFAEAQRATGQGAAELSGQQQVANPPLREALQMAAELATARMAQAAAQAADIEAAQNEPVGTMEGDTNQPVTKGDNAKPVADAGQQPTPGQPGQSSPSNRPPQSPPADDTGFVPQSPELTAQMMAGPELAQAMQAADQQLGQASKPSDGKASSRQQAQLDTNSAVQPSSNKTSKSSQAAMQANRQTGETQNNESPDNPSQKPPEGTKVGDTLPGQRNGDADAAARAFEGQPWFAKLPPELRKSIRAGSQQKAPRAYEDRLRRYFQSVE